MNNSYLVIIGIIAVAYMAVMYVVRFFLKKKHGDNAESEEVVEYREPTTAQQEVEGVVIGEYPAEAMKTYMEKMLPYFSTDDFLSMWGSASDLEKTLQGFNVNNFQLVWASTYGNTNIERIVAYNDKEVLLIPAKVLNGKLVIPVEQPAAFIDLSKVDHIWLGRKVSWARIAFVQLFFDAKNDKDNIEIWGTKKDPCGNDNNPSFAKFIDFMEQWAKEHNVQAELIK